jgi:hypothetical protein
MDEIWPERRHAREQGVAAAATYWSLRGRTATTRDEGR